MRKEFTMTKAERKALLVAHNPLTKAGKPRKTLVKTGLAFWAKMARKYKFEPGSELMRPMTEGMGFWGTVPDPVDQPSPASRREEPDDIVQAPEVPKPSID